MTQRKISRLGKRGLDGSPLPIKSGTAKCGAAPEGEPRPFFWLVERKPLIKLRGNHPPRMYAEDAGRCTTARSFR
jgi:hypothetical protein